MGRKIYQAQFSQAFYGQQNPSQVIVAFDGQKAKHLQKLLTMGYKSLKVLQAYCNTPKNRMQGFIRQVRLPLF